MRILVLGGRGFIGKAVCEEIKKHDIITFDRKPGNAKHFKGSILSLNDVREAMRDVSCVINLVGLSPLRKLKSSSYDEVHVQGIRNVIRACKEVRIKKLIHMGTLGADKNSQISYIRTKGIAEELVINSGLKVNVFCPSIIYGKKNELVRMISRYGWTRIFPRIEAKIQPVYRKDISRLFNLAVEGKIKEKKLEVGGPDVMTIFQFAEIIYNKKGYICIGIPQNIIKVCMKAASLFSLLGITKEQVMSLSIHNTTTSKTAEKYVKLTSFKDWIKYQSI